MGFWLSQGDNRGICPTLGTYVVRWYAYEACAMGRPKCIILYFSAAIFNRCAGFFRDVRTGLIRYIFANFPESIVQSAKSINDDNGVEVRTKCLRRLYTKNC